MFTQIFFLQVQADAGVDAAVAAATGARRAVPGASYVDTGGRGGGGGGSGALVISGVDPTAPVPVEVHRRVAVPGATARMP